MPAPKKTGKRYVLLNYQRSMDRIWRAMLLLAPVLWAAWWQARRWQIPELQPPKDLLLLFGALLASGLLVFGLLMRSLAYVQPRQDHILVRTPYLPLRISYRRVKSVRPVELLQLFTPGTLSWADRRFLGSLLGTTATALILKNYPLSPALLRLFLPKVFFHPKDVGFVLLVKDWMGLSNEIDSLFGNWQQNRIAPQESHMSRRILRG